ncbi:MAG: HYR domain-containing protein, partial [Flavobacteriaceae bacterium]|nr:HYR domain-containing protein [Flavobacteriaceae bacterium]
LDYSALAVVDDNCDATPLISQSPLAGTVFTGTTTVTLTVTDASGNSASTTFDVSVLDTTAPEILNMPSDMVLSAGITCDAIGIWTEPTVIDNCNASPIVTSDWSSGDVFPLGITVITYIASDGINTSTASFTITVVDDESPTIECPADLVVDPDSNNQYILLDYTVDAIVFDNCTSNPVVSQSPAAGTVVTGGSIIDITLTAIDAAGNIGSCTFELTVEEYLSITETTFNENEIIVYPNPAETTFNIQNNGFSVLNRVDIFDLRGRLIRTFPINQDGNTTQIDVSRFDAGVYWITIYSENNRIIKSLIIE